MKEVKKEEKESALRGPGKGKDRQSAVTQRLSKIGPNKKAKP